MLINKWNEFAEHPHFYWIIYYEKYMVCNLFPTEEKCFSLEGVNSSALLKLAPERESPRKIADTLN